MTAYELVVLATRTDAVVGVSHVRLSAASRRVESPIRGQSLPTEVTSRDVSTTDAQGDGSPAVPAVRR